MLLERVSLIESIFIEFTTCGINVWLAVPYFQIQNWKQFALGMNVAQLNNTSLVCNTLYYI